MFFFITTILTILVAAYIIKSLVLPLSAALWIKMILAGLILIGSQKMGIYWLLGNIFPVLQMRGVMIFFGIAQAWIFIMFLGVIMLNLLSLFKVFIQGALPIMLIATFLMAVFSVWQALRVPSVKEVKVVLKELPLSWQPLRIVQLSDLHIGSGFNGKWLKQVVDKTNALQPDVIVITGDSIDNTVDQLSPQMEPLRQLKAPLGVYMVFGNHEYYYGPDAWEEAFEKMGISVLHQKHVLLRSGAQTVALGGGTWGARYHPKRQDARLREIFDGVQSGVPRILLAHYPAVFPAAAQQDVLLQLSGHTHGGMTFPINLITKAFNSGYLRGLYQEDGRFLYVSDGTGLWGGLPARIGTQNEITLITVKRP